MLFFGSAPDSFESLGSALVFARRLAHHRSMRFAVILAGGGGTRLWPASRRAKPKQFLALGTRDGESLLGATARRLEPVCPTEQTVVVTAAEQAAEVFEALPQLPKANVICEPAARNTAAALGLAAVHLRHRNADAVMGAIPSDQLVVKEEAFACCLDHAFTEAAKREAIVTVGIVPTRPETGFGYMRLGKTAGPGLSWVDGFVEKPDAAKAALYIESGEYLWNGGMFFVRADYLLREIATYLPETAAGLEEIARELKLSDQAGADATARLYPHFDKVSIDYGVMERTKAVLTVPGDFGWNDVGSWSSLSEYRETDSLANVKIGNVVTHNAKRNVVVSDGDRLIGLVGVDDLVVISAGNAVLVAPRERAQEVRDLVAKIIESGDELERYL